MVRFGLGRRRGRGSQEFGFVHPLLSLRSRAPSLRKKRRALFFWVPASAGMTGVVHTSPLQSEGEVLAVVFWRLF